MRPRSLLAAAVTSAALIVPALAVALPAGAAAPGAPTHVQATVRIKTPHRYALTISGRARAGSRVVLQDRGDEHENWVSQKATTAHGGAFRFRLNYDKYGPLFRACVVRPGPDSCTTVGPTRVVKVPGRITLTDHASQLVPNETYDIATGRLSKVSACCGELSLQYQDPATRKWRPTRAEITVTDRRFTVGPSDVIGLVSKQGLKLRLLLSGNPWVKDTTKEWTVNSYTQRSLGQLPVQSGSMVQGTVGYAYLNVSLMPSAAVSPTNTVTLTVPAGCGRVQAGVTTNLALGPPAAAWSTHVLVNGVSAFDSTTAGASTFSLDVHGGDSLTLSVSFDPAHPDDRPWFVSPYPASSSLPKLPFVLCAAP